MLTIKLSQRQIITLNDCPVYGADNLERYFNVCQFEEELAYAQVIEKNIVKRLKI